MSAVNGGRKKIFLGQIREGVPMGNIDRTCLKDGLRYCFSTKEVDEISEYLHNMVVESQDSRKTPEMRLVAYAEHMSSCGQCMERVCEHLRDKHELPQSLVQRVYSEEVHRFDSVAYNRDAMLQEFYPRYGDDPITD